MAHDYGLQRALVDGVPEATLRLSAQQVAARQDDWASLFGPEPALVADAEPAVGP